MNQTHKCNWSLGLLGAGILANLHAAEVSVPPPANAGSKPAWLTELSLGVKESYDNNVLEVSGNGLPTQSSWITSVSPRVGFNFAPLLGNQQTLQTLSLSYVPDFNFYHEAASESYDAHRILNTIKLQTGNFAYSLDNSFLFNDGSDTSPLYALNQLGGAAGNQNDKYRNFFAQGLVRERREQIQDRASTSLQYNWNSCFVRPTASLLFYDLMTDWHNTSVAPYKGYQDWPDRYDVNGGLDFGYFLMPKVALTLGYRYGHQYQEQFPTAIDADNHFSSSDYQRVLLGLEGKLWSWLNVKLAGGPDFRNYNSMAAVNDFHPVKYYGEGVITATLTPNQSLVFNYKQWQWVSATGKVPYFDSLFSLTYHWNPVKRIGLDLGGKIQEADFTSGNDNSGSAPSLRDDRQYSVFLGLTYAFTDHLSANLTYNYDLGDNVRANLPANLQPDYREFQHDLVSLGLQYKF